MKLKSWGISGTLFIVAVSLWSYYLVSRRAFLRDYNAGVHAYLAGQFVEAEGSLTKALKRWPKDREVRQLLTKTLVEQSFSQFHAKDYIGALATLERAVQQTPADDPSQQSLKALREQLTTSAEKRPMKMEQVLSSVYRQLPAHQAPNDLQAMMQQYFQKSQMSQEAMLKRFLENQETWLSQLERRKDQFREILYGGLFLFGIGGVILVILLVGVLHTYFGRRGVFARLLEDHYQRVVAALPSGSHVLLGPPVSLHQVPEAEQLDVIEAEIVSGNDPHMSRRRLEELLEGENPWLKARAAKILFKLNPALALEELKKLVASTTKDFQVAGMWGLAEIATADALVLLAPLAYSADRDIQQGAVRSLLQLQGKNTLSPDSRAKLETLLAEIRSRTGWIF